MAIINMRIFKTVLFLVVAVTIVQGHHLGNIHARHPLSTSEVQDDKGLPTNLAESPVTKTEEKIQETDSLKTNSLKTDSLKTDTLITDSLKTDSFKPESEKIPSVLEPERQEETKPEISSESKPEDLISSSDVKPNPEDQNKPSSSPLEPQVPCSSATDRDCGSVPKPGSYVDQRQYDYDQRQNGTENYRIQVDGLVLVLAPVEALLLAGGMGSEMNGPFNFSSALDQPAPKTEEEQSSNISSKPELETPSHHKAARPTFYTSPKPADGLVSIKLINLIAPLLDQRRFFNK